jgi:hypothetical protein
MIPDIRLHLSISADSLRRLSQIQKTLEEIEASISELQRIERWRTDPLNLMPWLISTRESPRRFASCALWHFSGGLMETSSFLDRIYWRIKGKYEN